MTHRALLLLLVTLSMLTMMGACLLIEPEINPAKYEDWDARTPAPDEGRSGIAQEQDLPRVVTTRMEAYRAKLSDLALNFKLQCVFTVFALIVLNRRGRTVSSPMKIPILDVDVPALWLHVCTLVGLLWLWLQFGFTLNLAIDDRVVLFKVISAGEKVGANSIYSLRGVLGDGGFVDGWFHTFRTEHFELPELSRGFIAAVLALYGVFFGLGHACVYGLVLALSKRFMEGSCWFWVTVLMSSLVIAGSHVMFYWYGNRNWIHHVVGVATIGCTAVLVLWRRSALSEEGPGAVVEAGQSTQ